jgi:hypothetical protein
MNKKLNEKIVYSLIAFSLLTSVAAVILMGLVATKDDPILDVMASYCLVLCAIPFVSLQFFMSAGIYVSIFSDLYGFVKFLLYLFVFPFANLWLVAWLDVFWHFLPVHDSLKPTAKLISILAVSLWIILNGSGLIFRIIKSRKNVHV